MTIFLRLILTTIIPTLLAQPVWAMGAEKLIEPCTQCKETGFADGLPINADGIRTYGCVAYFAALRDFRLKMCGLPADKFGPLWSAFFHHAAK